MEGDVAARILDVVTCFVKCGREAFVAATFRELFVPTRCARKNIQVFDTCVNGILYGKSNLFFCPHCGVRRSDRYV